MSTLTRRDFLKNCALAAAALPLTHLTATTPGLVRVAVDYIHIYSEPDFAAKRVMTRQRDELLNIYAVETSGSGRNPLWYRLWGGYAHSAYLQPVADHPQTPPSAVHTGGQPAEVCVPFSRIHQRDKNGSWLALNRVYYQTVHWVTALEDGPDGRPWFKIEDIFQRSYYVDARHLRLLTAAELAPLATEIPAREKAIIVSISEQRLWAYQRDKVVYETNISSGRPQKGDLAPGEIPTDTLVGDFHVTVKTPSRHMGDKKFSDELNSGALIGVPWVSFFHESGLSLHGTFWHNNFGLRMSHGCINLRNDDARWIYRWTAPTVGLLEQEVSSWGTRVSVRE
jgi:lipoprotein-anchoring transpeptidase ErfK/SrfK